MARRIRLRNYRGMRPMKMRTIAKELGVHAPFTAFGTVVPTEKTIRTDLKKN